MTETADRKPIRPHTVSELDGTQQGGLAFAVALLGGMVAAAAIAPGALTSFAVWVALLLMAVGVASAVQRIFAKSEEGAGS